MGINGVVFIYNPDQEEHPRILESFHTQFVSQQRLKEKQCIVFCHSKPDTHGYACKLCKYFICPKLHNSFIIKESIETIFLNSAFFSKVK